MTAHCSSDAASWLLRVVPGAFTDSDDCINAAVAAAVFRLFTVTPAYTYRQASGYQYSKISDVGSPDSNGNSLLYSGNSMTYSSSANTMLIPLGMGGLGAPGSCSDYGQSCGGLASCKSQLLRPLQLRLSQFAVWQLLLLTISHYNLLLCCCAVIAAVTAVYAPGASLIETIYSPTAAYFSDDYSNGPGQPTGALLVE